MLFKGSRSKVLGLFQQKQTICLSAKYYTPQSSIYVGLSQKACDMSLRDLNNASFEHVRAGFGNFARFGHGKMVRVYLFSSSLVRKRRIEAKKYSRLSRISLSLQKPSRNCLERSFVR